MYKFWGEFCVSWIFSTVPLMQILRNTVFQGNKMSVMQGIGVYRPFLSILIFKRKYIWGNSLVVWITNLKFKPWMDSNVCASLLWSPKGKEAIHRVNLFNHIISKFHVLSTSFAYWYKYNFWLKFFHRFESFSILFQFLGHQKSNSSLLNASTSNDPLTLPPLGHQGGFQSFISQITTPAPWLTQFLVLGKSRVNQKSR